MNEIDIPLGKDLEQTLYWQNGVIFLLFIARLPLGQRTPKDERSPINRTR
jgi:hypothetical protein